ncbi:MAG: DUF5011 domain-containing protein [Bacteroidia bacterium]
MNMKSSQSESFGSVLGKKPGILLLSSIIILFILFLASCAKEDTVAPVLTLKMGNNLAMPLPTVRGAGVWTDPGFTAWDNVDHDVTNQVHVFGQVNPNLKGTYTLTYSVKDAAGNVTTQTRTVIVYNDADSLAGTYTVRDSTAGLPIPATYAIVLSSDSLTDSIIHFDKFAGYYNNSGVTGKINRLTSTLTIPDQTVTFTPSTTSVIHAFIGSGNDSLGKIIQTVIHLNFIDSNKTTAPYTATTHYTRWTH